jgi:hypothetical protein
LTVEKLARIRVELEEESGTVSIDADLVAEFV